MSTNRKQYRRYLKSAAWQAKRAQVILRDRGECRRCGSRYKLEVHHKNYVRFGHERLSDLVTLCQLCHTYEHRCLATKSARSIAA
jgi:5-methylcytosine-specific restriction endonuclease McrA